MQSAVNIILLSMHREPGLNSDKPISVGPSLYMKELHDFLLRTWNLHISPFADKQSVENCGKELAGRCIELFARNAAIVRPISSAGRNRLKTDCFHLEGAIKPLINDPSTLGKPYRWQYENFVVFFSNSKYQTFRFLDFYVLCQPYWFCRRKNYRINQSNPVRPFHRTSFSIYCSDLLIVIYKVLTRQLAGRMRSYCNG